MIDTNPDNAIDEHTDLKFKTGMVDWRTSKQRSRTPKWPRHILGLDLMVPERIRCHIRPPGRVLALYETKAFR